MYTKQEKINKLCEKRNFTGTNAEKIAFIQRTIIPQVTRDLTQKKEQLEKQIATLQEELVKVNITPLQELNRRAIMMLRVEETKLLTNTNEEL